MRKQKHAMAYLDDLSRRARADPALDIHTHKEATIFAWALILVALFSDAERALLTELYEIHAETGSDPQEVHSFCIEQQRLDLCRILEQIFLEHGEARKLTEFMKRAIDEQWWRPVHDHIKAQDLEVRHFLWEGR
ncbi:MAG: hypothetical protein JXB35_11890 [Anaerolineae bacterium]|nr:hypothetical protein [Anaerolineae bacterium]